MNQPLELEYWPKYSTILGMDEAGRGPLCGPLVVAGVIFPQGYLNPWIDDSKKLSAKKREALFEVIQRDALAYWIVFVDEKTIDQLNIYRATQEAMRQIAQKAQADFVLTDAMPLPNCENTLSIVRGDQKVLSIAAASILAKVSRDHYMEALDALYPQYGLKSHKGYPTKKHLEALNQYGIQSFYRRSFGPVKRQLLKTQSLF